MKEQLKEVDYFFGVNSAEEIAQLIVLHKQKENTKKYKRHLLTPKHYAYIKISEGCNHKCSFCAIPIIRGRHISIPIEDIVKEVDDLYKQGVKEFNIIGQDTTYYGYDLYGKRNISELLSKIAESAKGAWIRLLYTFPTNFPEDLIYIISRYENICKYIDIPLQHASDKILKSMNRGITKKQILILLDKIRKIIPNVAIRSTFIVGFPGETEKDFNELRNFIIEQQLDRVGVFTYSHEENTDAYSLNDNIPEELKNERKAIILKTQKEISFKKNLSKIGSVLKVLIDEKFENQFFGRTQYDAPDIDNKVIIPYNKMVQDGQFINVKINSATYYDLFGELSI